MSGSKKTDLYVSIGVSILYILFVHDSLSTNI